MLTTELWIVIGVLAAFFLLTTIFIIIAARRVSITAKKIDFLVEDLTFKSQLLNDSVQAIVKLTGYIDILDQVIRNDTTSIAEVLTNSDEQIFALHEKLQNYVKSRKTTNEIQGELDKPEVLSQPKNDLIKSKKIHSEKNVSNETVETVKKIASVTKKIKTVASDIEEVSGLKKQIKEKKATKKMI